MKKFHLPEPVKACPFCASKNVTLYGHLETLTLECKCGAKITKAVGLKGADLNSMHTLINKWNTREGVSSNNEEVKD